MAEHDILVEFSKAIKSNDVARLKSLVAEEAEILSTPSGNGNWLHIAAFRGAPEVINWLVQQGQEVDLQEHTKPHNTPLSVALALENLDAARCLLEHGADPNCHMSVITPVNGTKQRPLEAIKLLEEFGADLNKQYMNERFNYPMTALSMAKSNKLTEVVEYLESRGCTMPKPVENGE